MYLFIYLYLYNISPPLMIYIPFLEQERFTYRVDLLPLTVPGAHYDDLPPPPPELLVQRALVKPAVLVDTNPPAVTRSSVPPQDTTSTPFRSAGPQQELSIMVS